MIQNISYTDLEYQFATQSPQSESQVLVPILQAIDSGPQNPLQAIDSCPQNPLQNVSSPTTSKTINNKEFIVYTRRNKTIQEDNECPSHSVTSQESDLNSTPTETLSGNTEFKSSEFNDLELPIAVRKGVRSCTSHPISNFISYEKLSPGYKAFVTSLTNIPIPSNVYEALQNPEWKKAIEDEVCALEKNETWELTDLPKGKNPVGCKWIFTIKYKANGDIDRFKARLVAKGFTQSYGIDYQETFAPVAKLNTIRILLSLAVNLDQQLHQLDVKNAFLNGDLEEEVYMDIPSGLEKKMNINKVCRLRKSLYGLKQSPQAWFDRFTKVVKKFGYSQCHADHTLFIKYSKKGKITIIIIYVDDIILTGDNEYEISNLKKFLAQEFEIKDLGNLKYFLGMEVARSRKGIIVSQQKYVLDLLKERDAGMQTS